MTRPYFKEVHAMPGYRLEIAMETGSVIIFGLEGRLSEERFAPLRDERLFYSAHTDGDYLLFGLDGGVRLKIGARELADMILVE